MSARRPRIQVGPGKETAGVQGEFAHDVRDALNQLASIQQGDGTGGGFVSVNLSGVNAYTITFKGTFTATVQPFTFVTDGVESAVRQARQAAGPKDVVVSTASILQQCLNAGLMDEIHVDVTPLPNYERFDAPPSEVLEWMLPLIRLHAYEARLQRRTGFR